MGKHVYFERKYDAENTRRMLEEVIGQKVTLKKSSKGWYADIDKAYLTKDGTAVSKGSIVYSESSAYEVAEYDVSGESATVRLRPIYATEPDKNKDVREGIIWYCSSDISKDEIKEKIKVGCRFHNDIDGRNFIDTGDFVYIERHQTYYKVVQIEKELHITKSISSHCRNLQCVEIVGDELRVIHSINQRNRYYQLSEFYSRPLTKMERILTKVERIYSKKIGFGIDPFIGIFAAIIMLIIFVGMIVGMTNDLELIS